MLLDLLLTAAEVMTPGGFYLLFFGVSALAVVTLTGVGLVEVDCLQWLLFRAWRSACLPSPMTR